MSEDLPTVSWSVGWGFDAHALTSDPPLLLAGVIVSDSVGVAATSDGDVAAHAVTDAVLGAAALGDMGEHFPSSDPRFEDANSLGLLRQSTTLAYASGWQVVHMDLTVVAQSVRVAPYREQMRTNLAEALGCEIDNISVKATTTDGLGFIGNDHGIAAVATVTAHSLT